MKTRIVNLGNIRTCLKQYPYIVALVALVSLVACKERDPLPNPKPQSEASVVNQWIWDAMQDVYLWEAYIPQDLTPDKANGSEAYFESLLYEEDQWSWITDDVETLKKGFDGVSKSMGYEPGFSLWGEDGAVLILINYVTPNTPAARAGLKRGDIILGINGVRLTRDNYYELFKSAEYQSITFGVYNSALNNIGVDKTSTLSMVAEEMSVDPVHKYEILEVEGHKIAYLVYNQFSNGSDGEWKSSLSIALSSFKNAGVKDLVLDLRHNPGGYITSAQFLSSALAPVGVDSKDLLVSFKMNDELDNYYAYLALNGSTAEERAWASRQLYTYFEDVDPSVDLDLSRLYVLTSKGSASASELLITGLRAYMGSNVVLIGENTAGKYTASITIADTKDPARHSWAMQPIIARYANKNGVTDFKDGFTPNHVVDPLESCLLGFPLGSVDEPLLAKAIELITGRQPSTKARILKSNQEIPFVELVNPERKQKETVLLH